MSSVTARVRPNAAAPGLQPTPFHTKTEDQSSSFKLVKMCGLAMGIYVSFIVWGVFQEKLGTTAYVNPDTNERDRFQAPHVLILSQCVFSILFSITSISPLLKDSAAIWKKSWRTVTLIGFAMSVGAPLSYVAMAYIPYPFVVTVKMCKLIPIVVLGLVVFKEKYSGTKKMVCLVITIGVLGFSFFTPRKPDSGIHGPLEVAFGVFLVILNLVIDGLHNSAQDSLKHHHKLGAGALQAISNISCFVWVAVILVGAELAPSSVPGSKQLSFAISFFWTHPSALRDVVALGFLNAVGQLFIFGTIAAFDSIAVTSINVTRKVFSVVASVFLNNHNLNMGQWGSLLVVIFGVVVETHANITNTKASKKIHKTS